jgi:hypothetical protein
MFILCVLYSLLKIWMNKWMNEFVIDLNCNGGVMFSELVSSAVDCGFEPRSGQTKGYTIGIVASLLSTQH